MTARVGIVHFARIRWPDGCRGIQFAAHLQPGWLSLCETGPNWRHNLCLDLGLWRLDIGIGKD